MKIIYISLAVLVAIFIVSQIYFYVYDNSIETHRYQVVQEFGIIEIRSYESALFASVTVDGNMFDTQNKAFYKLGGYIFGGNEKSQKNLGPRHETLYYKQSVNLYIT